MKTLGDNLVKRINFLQIELKLSANFFRTITFQKNVANKGIGKIQMCNTVHTEFSKILGDKELGILIPLSTFWRLLVFNFF